MTRFIPGGRGKKIGTDADVVQRESYDERTTRIPKRSGWMVGNFLYPATHGSTVTCAADTVKLSFVGKLEEETTLYEARVSVDTNQANSVLQCAIYRYGGREFGFKKIPGTDVTFPGDAAGQITMTLLDRPSLSTGVVYFIGSNTNDATLGLHGFVATNDSVLSPSSYGWSSSGGLPESVRLSLVSKDATLSVPAVMYLSREAAEVI